MTQRGEPGGGLSADAFATLLGRLGSDAESAGAAYETLRRALVGFFTWRGAATPEECADETLDRLAARLEQGEAVKDLPAFARGIARFVLLEHWRRPDAQRTPLDEAPPTRAPTTAEPGDEPLHFCLDRCLTELPGDARTLILDYYVAEGRSRIERRKQMAKELGVLETALRNRAQRLRDRLERCLTDCLGEPSRDRTDTNA